MASSHSSAALNPLLGTLDNPNDFIGMHSDYAMTFDLDEIRMAGGWNENQWFNFSTTLTGTHTSSKTVTGVLLLSSDEEILSAYVNGQLFDVVNEDGVWSLDGLSPDTPLTVTGSETAEFNVDLGADAKFLTLALLCAGDMNTDHAAWFNPTLTAIQTQNLPEPASWAILALGTCGLLFLRRRGGRSKN